MRSSQGYRLTTGGADAEPRCHRTERLDHMLRHLAVALLTLIGDFSPARPLICIFLGAACLSLVYWLALPTVFPFWPVYPVLLLAAFVGFIWQQRSKS